MSCNLGLLVEASSKLSDVEENDCEMMEQRDKENVVPEHPMHPPSNFIATDAATVAEQGRGGVNDALKKMNYRHVLYCKARGMPIDHVGNNAILLFDEGYEGVHGAELKCSHKACAKDGVKFRWCAHCNKAVAKRYAAHCNIAFLPHAHPSFQLTKKN